MKPQVSVVIPVFNEEQGLPLLFARLFPALDGLRRSYEVIFVDDGSRDRSVEVLRGAVRERPENARVVVLATTPASISPSSPASNVHAAPWWSRWMRTCRTRRADRTGAGCHGRRR